MLLSAGAANAALYNFTLTGGYTASWQLDSAPAPDVTSTGEGFILWDVEGFNDALLGVADITFYNIAIGGGLGIEDFYGDEVLLVADGPQLYTGSESNPVFSLGTFVLTEFLGTQTYILTISQVGAGGGTDVPEPATGALLLGGIAVMAALRKRKAGALAA